jgi:hypothetical protein
MPSQSPITRAFALSTVAIIILTTVYVLLYQFQPLPVEWNNAILNFSFAVAAGLGALAATLTWRQFQPGEMPRRIWGFFALAMWGWASAEVIWGIYALLMEEVPEVTLADVPWVGSFALFAISFLLQFRLIFATSPSQERKWLAGATGGVLLAALAGTWLLRAFGGETEQTWSETYLAVFYPCADLALALAAIKLGRVFGRGMWGRAWMGLLVMVGADLLYSFLTFSGLYAQSAENGNPLSLIADTLYFDAYLLLALACYTQYLLLRHGPPPVAAQEIAPS